MPSVIRPLRPSEYLLLREFLYQAVFVPPGASPPPRTILDTPELQVYLTDFGQSPHDKALAAELDGQVVGLVWTRIMHDYGYVDDSTPSFALALLPEYRGQAIGTELMRAMLALLRSCGYAQASLAVQKANYAVKLYQKVGFTVLREIEEEYIMICKLQ